MSRVLIVDDSKFARASLRKLLESLDYEVVGEAVDGADGVKKFKELKTDLIISDIEMPKLDGIAMIKEIRTFDDSVKIVVVSSIVSSKIIQEVVGLRASVVKKPLKKSKLINAIELTSR
ncbi:MAG: response regulator [Sulfurimonas sp.]|nr:response regulator [Sulfurimonas sp.]